QELSRLHRRRLAEPVKDRTRNHQRQSGRGPGARVTPWTHESSHTASEARLVELGVNFGKLAIDVSPRGGRRGQMALENILAVAYACADRILQLLQFAAAVPAGFEMRTDLRRRACGRLSVSIPEQLSVFRMAH